MQVLAGLPETLGQCRRAGELDLEPDPFGPDFDYQVDRCASGSAIEGGRLSEFELVADLLDDEAFPGRSGSGMA